MYQFYLLTDRSVDNNAEHSQNARQNDDPATATLRRGPAVVPLRQRLPPEVRVLQILDAALVEFSERGFAAARMDDIARRCGLSKGGLYAHFAGKEEVFEALLTRSLAPPDFGQMPVLGNGIRPLAQWVVDKLYDSLGRPGAVATLRLLVAESARVPHLVALWKRNVVQPHLTLLGDILRAHAVQEGWVPSVITQEPWLVVSPVVHALLSQVVLGDTDPHELAHYRQGHVALLCELLDPASRILPPLQPAAKWSNDA